ncbi:MAG: response regulator [Bdellovibrionales bacterium]|nr:response regulator [Bdellovibrionales bacterium]
MQQEIKNSCFGKQILVAEDCPDARLLLKYTLKEIGVEVSFVNNGKDCVKEALRALNDNSPYRLILMDIQMPILDGYEATKQLRSKGYKYPIVILSTRSTSIDQEATLDVGCNCHLSKQSGKEVLLETVAGYLQ